MIETLLEWRREVWLGLPACDGMAELTWHFTSSAGDLAVLLAFYLADMKPEFDRYGAESSRTSATIAQLAPAVTGSTATDLMLPESKLPKCTQHQMNQATDIIVEYTEQVAAADAVLSIDDVFAFAERQYKWREARLSALERCAEVFELGLLIDQSTGDAVVTMALLLSGIDAGDIPHVEAMQEGAAKMSALVTPIIKGERAGTKAPLPRPLPQCADEELGVVISEIEPKYWELITADYAAETIEDFLRVSEMQIEFRDTIWSQLPACAQAYDIAWLMYRVTGDSILTMALLVAGAAEDIVLYSATAGDMSRLTTMLLEIGDATEQCRRLSWLKHRPAGAAYDILSDPL